MQPALAPLPELIRIRHDAIASPVVRARGREAMLGLELAPALLEPGAILDRLTLRARERPDARAHRAGVKYASESAALTFVTVPSMRTWRSSSFHMNVRAA